MLADPRIQIYDCGRRDIATGQIDRRVLATLEFLVRLRLQADRQRRSSAATAYLTTSGNVSEHSTGTAVDIAAINGIPIVGNQGKGSITELTIQRLLTLQGTMKPHQIISLMTFAGTDNTLAMADHADHIHVGWRPLYGANSKARQAGRRDPQAQAVDQADRPPRRRSTTRRCASRRRKYARQGQSSAASPPTRASDARPLFGFVQWEFAGRLGPDPGRYVVRRFAGDDGAPRLVIGGARGAAAAPLPRRRGAGAPAPEPARSTSRAPR